MAKFIQIQVPKPCHEDWDKMEPRAEGSFCQSCQKTVIDFTGMTDGQLIEYFKKPITNACGRFYTDQLDKHYELPAKRIPWLRYFFTISLPALLITYKSNAQRLIKKINHPIVLTEKKNSLPVLKQNHFTVSGRVMSSSRIIAHASITIDGTNEGAIADSNGYFKLLLTGKEKFIEVSAIGYKTKQIELNGLPGTFLHDILLEEKNNLAEIVVTVDNRIRKGQVTSGFTRISSCYISNPPKKLQLLNDDDSLKNVNTAEVFPNPVSRNDELTIRWKKPVSKNQMVMLYNSAGMKLLQKEIAISSTAQQLKMKLDVKAAGNYFIHLIDTKSGLTQTIPIIID